MKRRVAELSVTAVESSLPAELTDPNHPTWRDWLLWAAWSKANLGERVGSLFRALIQGARQFPDHESPQDVIPAVWAARFNMSAVAWAINNGISTPNEAGSWPAKLPDWQQLQSLGVPGPLTVEWKGWLPKW